MSSNIEQKLSPRQYQILELITRGLTNKEICRILSISSNTVKVHVAAILQILDVTNRTEAAMVFSQHAKNRVKNQANSAQLPTLNHSIAVLPFADLTTNNEFRILLQGLSESLITHLLAWRFFPILSSDAVISFTQKDLLGNSGKELGISYIVSGSIQNSGTALRISYSVSETSTGKTIISRYHYITENDPARVQDFISLRIAANITPLLLANEGMIAGKFPFLEMDCWHSTMRGFYLLEKRTLPSLHEALQCFNQAVKIDPSYTAAWYGLTLYYYRMYTENRFEDRSSIIKIIGENASKCLLSDNNNALGYLCIVMEKMVNGMVHDACIYIDKAIFLNPGFVNAYMLKGQIYAMLDRMDEALLILENAMSLSSDLMVNGINLGSIALVHFANSNYVESIMCCEQCLNMIPGNIYTFVILASSYALSGDISSAKETVTELLHLYPDFKIENIAPLLNSINQNHVSRLINGLKISGAVK